MSEELDEATRRRRVSDEERRIIQPFGKLAQFGPKVSDEERSILKKWRDSNLKTQE